MKNGRKTTQMIISLVAGMALSAVGGVVATGGSVTRIHNDYIHTFTESGTLTVTKPGTVQVLVVGGGGGGGASTGGGGGGGGGGVVFEEEFELTS